jgi:hypothetical protein
LLSAALVLPEGDRLELIALLQSEEKPPIGDSWREVVAKRSAELRSG